MAADWTDIPNTSLEPDAPARSIDALALRDNPVAIAEGAAGAPRVQAEAIGVSASLQATARDAVVGGVGTYAFLAKFQDPVIGLSPGDTAAGSGLRYAAASGNENGAAPAGTWRCMGYVAGAPSTSDLETNTTLFLRIS